MPYSLEQLRAAYRNAKQGGDEASASLIWQALIEQRTAEDTASGLNTYSPTEGMSTGSKLLAGIGQGMTNVARHAGNLINVVDDQELADAKKLDRSLLETGAGRAGSFVGEIAATAPLTAGAVNIASRLPSIAKALKNPITRGVSEGAVHGGVLAEPGERGAGAILGGAAGALVPGLGQVIRRAAQGVKRTPQAQKLLDRGVDLTPGQMNPGGVLSHLEEAWQSVPVVGSVVKGARSNAQQSFSRTLAQEAAAPGTKILQGDMPSMLEAAYRSFQPLYDKAKGFPVRPLLMAEGSDIPLAMLFKRAVSNRSVRATDETRKSVEKFLKNELSANINSSDDLLRLRSRIRTEIRKARLSGDASERAAADLMSDAEKSITKALKSQLPPDAMNALRVADAQYGKYKILEDAVARSADQPQGLSPAQLSSAIKSATERGVYARGGGTLRGLASAGRQAFTQTQPSTGARLAAIGIPIGVSATNPVAGALMGGSLAALVGTKTGRKIAAGLTKPQMLARALAGQVQGQLPAPSREVLAEYIRRASLSGLLPQER